MLVISGKTIRYVPEYLNKSAMLTKDQVYLMLIMRNRANTVFSTLPLELIKHISDFGQNSNNYINRTLELAASGEDYDLNVINCMVRGLPGILLMAGNVTTRGGIKVSRVTLYEFFLGEGDPQGAKRIEFGFKLILNGEKERIRQYARYRPYIVRMAQQIESGLPTFDLDLLHDIIIKSTREDIHAALMYDMNHESLLRDALITFRKVVSTKKYKRGLHFEHYTTLMQAINLIKIHEYKFKNIELYKLICIQIIGYLQLKGLPAVERFTFARDQSDEVRTLTFKDGLGAFPDCPDLSDESKMTGLGSGFSEAISGGVLHREQQQGATFHLDSAKWNLKVQQKFRFWATYNEDSGTGTLDEFDGIFKFLK